MESISGYTAPSSTELAKPSNFKSGSILNKHDIEGYEEAMRATNAAHFAAAPSVLLALTIGAMAGVILL